MRAFHRAIATTLAGLAIAAGIVPASATPEDGKGCVGSPDVPATYVCVISVTPENVVPTTTTTIVPVPVPELCYFLDCVPSKTVDVPVPGVTLRSGVVAVIWHKGAYIPISVGTPDALALLYSTIDLATQTAVGAAETAGETVAYAAGLANGLAATALGIAGRTADDAAAAADAALDDAGRTIADARDAAYAVRDYARDEAYRIRDDAQYTAQQVAQAVQETIDGLPTAKEVLTLVLDRVQRLLDDPRVEDAVDLVLALACLQPACFSVE
jgi:hypothetical protein